MGRTTHNASPSRGGVVVSLYREHDREGRQWPHSTRHLLKSGGPPRQSQATAGKSRGGLPYPLATGTPRFSVSWRGPARTAPCCTTRSSVAERSSARSNG